MFELFFWLSFAFIIYTYIGYPVSLLLLLIFCEKPVRKTYWKTWPDVTVVIAAKNEGNNIRKRIANLIEQDYPKSNLEIIVVSDGSTDSTVKILQEIETEQDASPVLFKAIVQQESAGKPSAINAGVLNAKGSILIFADARQRFATTAIKELVANFSDPRIGCVSGELEFIESSTPNLKVEMGAYWKYEKTIRKMESRTGSVIGATGAIYSMRKELYKELPTEILLDDVLIPLNVSSQKFRVIFDQTAKAYDVVSENVESEWKRKVRTLAGNWQLLSEGTILKKAFVHRFLYRLFWHKLARLLVPYSLVIMLVTSILSEGWIYLIFSGLQVTFYFLAILTRFLAPLRRLSLPKLCYFFCVLNVAAVAGFLVWITGKSNNAWKSPSPQGAGR